MTAEQQKYRKEQDEFVRRKVKLAVAPLRFESNGKEMMYCYPDSKHELAGWILYRHPDGQWVTLRKATDADVEKMSEAVSAQFHSR
jgi:hypothetical protein